MERRLIDGQRRRDPAQRSEEQSRWARFQRAQPEGTYLGGRGQAGERPYLHEVPDESGGHHGIGDLLRAERLRRGEDLDDVAARLRLRPEQLRAIEDGAYDVLPGTTYAIGFVRSYAGYLGLDAQEAVERFKRETQGAPAPSALAFPEPSREARVPRGWVLLLAVGIVGVLYAGWYYGSAEQADLGRSRPPEPGEVASLPGTAPAENAGAGRELTRGGPEREPVEASPSTAEGSAAPAAVTPPDASDQAPAERGEDVLFDDIWMSPRSEPEAVAEEGAPAAGPEDRAEDRPEDRAVAAVEAKPALLLRAHGETWVQVEGSDGDILLSRILRAGDEYAVPDRPGLSLTTGNAGALEILVDGRSSGMVGGLGKVRRDIALDDMRSR